MGLFSIPGLPPGSIRYTSGVRGSLQRRSRRGPGRRRRQLQPDACRVLHHRSADDFLPFLFFQASSLLSYPFTVSAYLISLEVPQGNGVILGFVLPTPFLTSLPFPSSKTKVSVVMWLGTSYLRRLHLGYFRERENEMRRGYGESWRMCSIMWHKGDYQGEGFTLIFLLPFFSGSTPTLDNQK